MRTGPLLASMSFLALLAACEPSHYGYYDQSGTWIESPNATAAAERNHALENGMPNYRTEGDGDKNMHVVHYDRAGYYDANGNYYTVVKNASVPVDMLPPPGQCRVWFPHRSVQNEPGVESCDGIQERVPGNAYVVYGG